MKKSIKFTAMILASMALMTTAYANDAIKNANNQLSVNIGAHDLSYHEIDNHGQVESGYLNSENGKQPVVKVAYTTQRDIFGINDIYLTASASIAHGDTDYDGYLQGGAKLIPFKNTTRSTTNDLNVRLGKGFTFVEAPGLQITPFIGAGYQLWVRDMLGEYGYKEDYSHISYEAGVLAQFAVTPTIVVSADVGFGKTGNAKMTAYLDEDVKFKLGKDNKTTIGVGVDYAFTPKIHFNAGYRMTKFGYGESPVVMNAYLEPESDSKTQELTVGVGFRF